MSFCSSSMVYCWQNCMSPELSSVIDLLLVLLTSELVGTLLVTLLCKAAQDLPKRQQERNNRSDQEEDRTYHWRVRSSCECKLASELLLWTCAFIVCAPCTVKQEYNAYISNKQGARISSSPLYLTLQTCLRAMTFWQLRQQKHLDRLIGPGCALQE